MNVFDLISSPNPRQRNEGYKQLYLDPKINGYLKKRLAGAGLNNVDSDEILQDGMIKLQQKIVEGKFRGESSVETFLLGICKYLILEMVRGNATNKTDLRDEFRENEIGEDDGIPMIEIDEKTAEENRRDVALNEEVDKMRENCREALRNYYFKNKSTREVAEIRGLKNPNQAKKLLARCRKYLRDAISGNEVFKN